MKALAFAAILVTLSSGAMADGVDCHPALPNKGYADSSDLSNPNFPCNEGDRWVSRNVCCPLLTTDSAQSKGAGGKTWQFILPTGLKLSGDAEAVASAAKVLGYEVIPHPTLDRTPASPQQRAYTLDQIDQMRAAVVAIETRGLTYSGSFGWISIPANYNGIITESGISDSIMDHIVEDKLRTYMAAGISPEDLESKAKVKP
jgi:hypothetical protein